MSRWATSAVQPVWCVAPRPSPVSPSKYSLNVGCSLHNGDRLASMRCPSDGTHAVDGPEQRHQRVVDDVGRLLQRDVVARPGRHLDGQRVAEEAAVRAQLVGEQHVEREPDRAAPVRVAAEHRRGRLAGFVVDARLLADGLDDGAASIGRRQRPDAERRQELVGVEQPLQDATQALRIDQRQQHRRRGRPVPAISGRTRSGRRRCSHSEAGGRRRGSRRRASAASRWRRASAPARPANARATGCATPSGPTMTS